MRPIEETGIGALIIIALYMLLYICPYIERRLFRRNPSTNRMGSRLSREEMEVAFQDVRPGRLSRMGTVAKVAGGGGDVFRVKKVRRIGADGTAERFGGGERDGETDTVTPSNMDDTMERGATRMGGAGRSESSLHPLVQFVDSLSFIETTLPRPAPALTPPESPKETLAKRWTASPALLHVPSPNPQQPRQQEQAHLQDPFAEPAELLPPLAINQNSKAAVRTSSLLDNDTLQRLVTKSGQAAIHGTRAREEAPERVAASYYSYVPGQSEETSMFSEQEMKLMRVEEQYIAKMDDEMTIRPGDQVLVEVQYADGWGYAWNIMSEKSGIIPLTCLGSLEAGA